MIPVLRSAILAGVVLSGSSNIAAARTQIVDEFKFGLLAHDIGLFDHHVETGADINFELLFTPPAFLDIIGSPRPHLGSSLNTAGNTNSGYFGLTWGITLIQNVFRSGDGIFVNGSLGGALQDGFAETAKAGVNTEVLDLTDRGAAAAWIAQIEQTTGDAVDVLDDNAGGVAEQEMHPIEQVPDTEWDRVLRGQHRYRPRVEPWNGGGHEASR